PAWPYFLASATRGKESSRRKRVTPRQTRDHRPCDRAHHDPHARVREVTMNTTWSRREFLEVSGAAVGASLAPTSLRAGLVPPSDTVRFGMIGVGMQGSGLLVAAITLPCVTCAVAADHYVGRPTLPKDTA